MHISNIVCNLALSYHGDVMLNLLKMANISELKGKIISSIDVKNNEILFNMESGHTYKMYHMQDCYESVCIDDINGELDDLLNTPVLLAEEVNSMPLSEDCQKRFKEDTEWGSATWTFYKLATIKGYVHIRWYGTSNGYYSESVDFILVGSEDDY